nr:GGDEF domain-containing protein [Alteromonas antoniana]
MACSLLCFIWASVVIVLYRPELVAILYAFGFYCLYLISTIKNAHAEFFRKLDIELTLIETQRELDSLARTDPLTGLANRRVYDAEMQRNFSLSKRHNTDFSLILLDLDHFKLLNDTHGHAIGDLCIKAVASVLNDTCRRELDIVARIGGEEFAIILPGTSIDDAHKLAIHIHQRFQELTVPEIQEATANITASIGVGSVAKTGAQDVNTLYELTDAAVYAAKQQGRNQIGIARLR